MTRHEDGPLPGRVRELALPLAQELEVEVLEIEISGPHSRPLIRVIADVADPTTPDGLDVDVIAKLSRQLGDELEEVDLVDGPFTLEVTSPGVDRPLTTPRDFQRNLGRDVRLEPREDAADGAPITGTLVAVDDEHVTLEVEGSQQQLAFADFDHGKVMLPW